MVTGCDLTRTALLEPLHLDRLRVGESLAVHHPVRRLPAEGVRTQPRHDVDGGELLAVAQRGGALDGPLVAAARPDSLPETATGLEHPGANLLATRIPADPLRPLSNGDTLHRGREG